MRTQVIPNTGRLPTYLKGAEAWGGVNKPTEALSWIASAESLALRLGNTLCYAQLLSWKSAYYRQRRAYTEAEVVLQEGFHLVEVQGAQRSRVYALLWRRRGGIRPERV
ncbi:MAG: hypothetical protein N2170_02315 [Bacteroidia bacterium]|nr:hypothetical protein [Bacteroidia bacterium]